MSESRSSGPILRKAGTRRSTLRRPKNASDEGTKPPREAKKPSTDEQQARGPSTPKEERTRATKPIRRRTVRPGNEGRATPPRAGSRRPAPERDAKPVDPAREARREQAKELAQSSGIPLAHAHRILQGQTTLNAVLKTLMHRERLERLVSRDGLDRSLAGQVAAGHLSKERALTLTRIRQFRKERLDFDAIKLSEQQKQHVALNIFGQGWVTGKIVLARVYDFDFRPDDGKELTTLHKHDIKAVASAEDLEALRASTAQHPDITPQALAGTAQRSERTRPSDEVLLTAIESEEPMPFIMRDGEVIEGVVVSFGRWDGELELTGGQHVHVMFHALHPGLQSSDD